MTSTSNGENRKRTMAEGSRYNGLKGEEGAVYACIFADFTRVRGAIFEGGGGGSNLPIARLVY